MRIEPKGLRLDCEQSLIFLLSHSSSRVRVNGEWRSREERGRKPRTEKKKRNCDGFFDLAICFSRLLDWHLTQYHLLLPVRDWDCLLLKSGDLTRNSCFTEMVILKYNKHVHGLPFFPPPQSFLLFAINLNKFTFSLAARGPEEKEDDPLRSKRLQEI